MSGDEPVYGHFRLDDVLMRCVGCGEAIDDNTWRLFFGQTQAIAAPTGHRFVYRCWQCNGKAQITIEAKKVAEDK